MTLGTLLMDMMANEDSKVESSAREVCRSRTKQTQARTQTQTRAMVSLLLLFLSLGASPFISCRAEVNFYLEKSWAFPEETSSSLILKDTRGEVDGTRVSSLTARSMNLSAPVTAPYNAAYLNPQLPQALLGKESGSDSQSFAAPDITDRKTLVNLAKAAWDAYYPAPNNDDWYGLDGVNWVSWPSLLELTLGDRLRHELR